MDKRFQVFVSSTYADLQDERRRVIQTLIEMDCIPAGMELFPAADEEQWAFIRRIIDDCDYYVLIIGNRYGSTTPDGISYTEKEHDYAVEKGLKVLAFVHSAPDELTEGADVSDDLRAKLAAFREKVRLGRLVKPWKEAPELPALVALSLQKTIRAHPAVGWVRGNQAAANEVLSELNDVRKEKEKLERAVKALRDASAPKLENLAGLGERVTVSGTYWVDHYHPTWSVTLTWGELFALVSPHLMANPHDVGVAQTLAVNLFKLSGKDGRTPEVNDVDYQTIKVQLMALGLVSVQYASAVGGGAGVFWSLTPAGQRLMLESRAIRSNKSGSQ